MTLSHNYETQIYNYKTLSHNYEVVYQYSEKVS